MSHSKRNTSLAFFTSHERSLLKHTWGTSSTRLSRDSFLPFGSCTLCLQPARSPTSCATHGDIFCRECIVSNLLQQKKEIKRLEKDEERRRADEEEVQRGREGEERERSVRDFERTMMGLEGRGKGGGKVGGGGGDGDGEKRGVKRGFEIDEGEMRRGVLEERKRARKALDEEKAAKPTLPSFWVPSQTPSTLSSSTHPSIPTKSQKLSPTCPASSSKDPHPLSLKTLITVNFTTAKDSKTTSTEGPTLICPACDKVLSNTIKAVMTVPCGHVLCKPCAGKFMAVPKEGKDAHAVDEGEEGVRCYVCEADLSGRKVKEKDGEGKKKDRESVKPGLVEIRSEGTGFAGGGKNMASREGVAFQC